QTETELPGLVSEDLELSWHGHLDGFGGEGRKRQICHFGGKRKLSAVDPAAGDALKMASPRCCSRRCGGCRTTSRSPAEAGALVPELRLATQKGRLRSPEVLWLAEPGSEATAPVLAAPQPAALRQSDRRHPAHPPSHPPVRRSRPGLAPEPAP